MMSTDELYKRLPWLREYPNMATYILTHGIDDLITIPWIAKDIDSAEEIYKKCVISGKTWRELLNFKETDEEVIW